jgi:hypothetical protein
MVSGYPAGRIRLTCGFDTGGCVVQYTYLNIKLSKFNNGEKDLDMPFILVHMVMLTRPWSIPSGQVQSA